MVNGPCLVAALRTGGLMETPPLWPATIISYNVNSCPIFSSQNVTWGAAIGGSFTVLHFWKQAFSSLQFLKRPFSILQHFSLLSWYFPLYSLKMPSLHFTVIFDFILHFTVNFWLFPILQLQKYAVSTLQASWFFQFYSLNLNMLYFTFSENPVYGFTFYLLPGPLSLGALYPYYSIVYWFYSRVKTPGKAVDSPKKCSFCGAQRKGILKRRSNNISPVTNATKRLRHDTKSWQYR